MTDATAPAFQGHGSKAYRAYVLGALVVIYTFNFVDRLLISIVQEKIIEDFGVSNFMMGLLGGTLFAVFYTAMGIPIARVAERANRVTIVSIGAALWSIMTALCGVAQNFIQLALCRLGVGVGEAACVPPSQSIIADYFPPERRATALSIFSLGIPFGSAIAAFGGGWLVANFDWRVAFILLGVPGILAAIIFKLTVKEPPRSGGTATAPGFGETLAALSRRPSFWHVAFGGALISLVGYGSTQFLVSFMVRNFELAPTIQQEIARASYTLGTIAITATALGTFLGGFLTDRLAPRHPRVHSWLPVLGLAVAVPLYVMAFMQTEFAWAFGFMLAAPVFHYLYLGPMYAATLSVVEPRQRATAVAILLLVVNLVGYGIGPPFVGAANDFFASSILADTSTLTLADCDPRTALPANLPICANAQALGVKYALGVTLIFLVWASIHFLLAGRTMLKDRVS